MTKITGCFESVTGDKGIAMIISKSKLVMATITVNVAESGGHMSLKIVLMRINLETKSYLDIMCGTL